MKWRQVGLVCVALVLAACSQEAGQPPQGAKQDKPPAQAVAKQPKAGQFVTVEVKEGRVPFWGLAEASVTVQNTRQRPIALLAVELRAAGGALVCRGGVGTVAAKATDDGAVIDGTLLVDDPGPAARAKFPDRWRWEGDAKLVHFPVLRPGTSFTATGSFRVTDKTGSALRATARFVELGDGVVLLGKTKGSLSSIDPPAGGTFGQGWVPTRKMSVTLGRTSKVADQAHLRDSWAGESVASSVPTFYLHGLLEPDFKALEAKSTEAEPVEKTFEVDGPPVSLAKAREQAGVASGPCTYFPAQSAWVLESEDATHIIGPDVKEKHPGRFVALIEALVGRGKAELTLFDSAETEDPGGHVAALTGKGLSAKSTKQKSGTYRGTVEIGPSDLGKLLAALAERSLRVDGLRAQ